MRSLLDLAAVTETGAIVLGSRVAVDGHAPGYGVRVVTHIHQDHILGLRRSIREASLIAATPLTLDLLEAAGYRIPPSKRLSLPYRVQVSVEGDVLSLRRANHVPGAAEVLVELENGVRVGYTGDFKLPGTEVLSDLDVLVIDATYGLEDWVRPWQEEIDLLLADVVREGLSHGPVYLYGYYGKIEEIMLLLRNQGVDAPFLVNQRVGRSVEVLERHGYRVGDVVVEGTREAVEVKRSGWYIGFRHYSSWRRRRSLPGENGARPVHVLLTGWEFREPFRRLGPRELVVSFSDHADFRQLVSYVEEARPRLLVADSYRGGRAAAYFASYVSKRLGIPAVALPGGGVDGV
ncbi:MBL fold metallo-hydrolase [Pyrodictium occultum]|uniref:MBL fold metallo-hydrolase n=1 Tax=Pyrodictium occultum TaxID=2309 RepID=UPI001F26BF72|nr:MBL fold metallo-hydrolase [Pyrodictium occultum]